MKLKTGFIALSLPLLFLGACNEPNEETTPPPDNVSEESSDPHDKLSERTGYIQWADSESIWVTPAIEPASDRDGIVFYVTDIDKGVLSNLKKGQQVTVTMRSALMYSDPPKGIAIKVEPLEEQ
ncbi:DUF3221 domain-containing protein [Domibacillus iocasae]|uniref:DUF3221 domain-containing protein n=1 Tax=Domibacillus iocasae TaxID=1714016 RepID=A0A1E7DRK5_9BACI|nr:DUF3221 domain-containing protein [Domibacillus iocasae]OES45625.1 hypothetical protein BA724_02100 [Domibacillus iocasae]